MGDFQKIKKIAQKCLKCKHPACVKYCPLGNPIPQILSAIEEDDIERAKKLLIENTNVGSICSKLCDVNRQCYGHCVLGNTDKGSVAFYEVESYLADLIQAKDYVCTEYHGKRVAIIGAGLAGISAAIDLAQKGYHVEMFEQQEKIGGVITDTLPDFRFTETEIEKYRALLDSLGVQIHYRKEWGKNLLMEDLDSFEYILFALGTGVSKRNFPNLPFIYDGIEVLRAFKHNHALLEHKRVLVIGGGNVAMDVARALKHMNNDVKIVYRRTMDQAPASQIEIAEARNEGIMMEECASPIEPIYQNQLLTGLLVEQTRLVEEQTKGRKDFQKTGLTSVISADAIVEAIGLIPEYKDLQQLVPEMFADDGWLKPEGIATYRDKTILVIGDYLIGASSFARAVASAKQAVEKVVVG
ncbi:MAG: FAD-dependent oxidoreductase [Prevotella sp.]|nr:FAD-dependent oxidoreductase [Staphylococcus sp.]MCM1349633.1 FAD-dependent oxidoreductase [Prevotella sp.]